MDPDLTGIWQRLREDGTLNDQFTFGANGEFKFDETTPEAPGVEDHLTGTYEADGRIATVTATDVTGEQRVHVTFSYHAGKTSFSSLALLPVGAHQGVVGTWEGRMKLERLDDKNVAPYAVVVTETYRADGTFAITHTHSDGSPSDSSIGTYAPTPAGTYEATRPGEDVPFKTFQLLDDGALVSPHEVWTKR